MTRTVRSARQEAVHSRGTPKATALPQTQRDAGARKIVSRKHKRGASPCDRRARQQKRRGEMQAYPVQVMQHRDDSLSFRLPTLQQTQKVVGRALIQGGKRLIEQNDVRVLQNQPCE